MTKKLAAAIAALALCFSIFTVTAFAADVPKSSETVPAGATQIEYNLKYGEEADYDGFVALLNQELGLTSDVSDWTYYQKGWYVALSNSDYVPIHEDSKKKSSYLTYSYKKLEFPQKDASQWQIYDMQCNGKYYTVALKLVDVRESAVTFKDSSLELSFSGDLSTAEGVAQLKSMIYAGIIEKRNVPLNELNLEYKTNGLFSSWKTFDSGISDVMGSECKLRISHPGNEQYKSVDNYEISFKLIDGREPAATFKDGPLVLSFSGDLSTAEGMAQLKSMIYAGIIEKSNVPQNDLKLQYLSGEILVFENWKDLDSSISTSTGSEYTLRISHPGTSQYKAVDNHEFTLIFDNRKPTSITLNENATVVYDEDYAALEAAALKQIVSATAGLPEDAQLNIKYHANVKLSDAAKTKINDAVVNSLDFIPTGFRELAGNTIINALDGALAKTDLDAWVSFSGGKATISSEDLGLADAIRDIKLVPENIKQMIIDNIDAILGKTDLELAYDPISVGEYEVRVSYTSESGLDYRPCAVEGNLTVKPAPVKLSVVSGSIYVDDTINGSLKATRTDTGKTIDSVAGLTLYAGITSDAKALITLDLTDEIKKNDAYQVINGTLQGLNIDLEKGVTLKQLFGDSASLEKLRDVFKALGLGDSFDSILMDALEKALENALGDRFDKDTFEQLINGATSGQMGEFLDKLKSSLGEGLDSVIANVGDSVIFRLDTPEGTAGAYAVVGYLSDEHYVADSAFDKHAVGYLLIKFHQVAVTVGNEKIGPNDDVPNLVTTEPADAQTFTIYTGVTSGLTTAVYLDVPKTAQFENVKTVGELRAQMVKTPGKFLEIMGIDSPFYEKVLTAAAGLDNLDADIPVTYGTPKGQTGAYTVTALAYGKKADKPWGYGVGTGTLAIGYNTISLKVNSQEICEEGTPSSFVSVDLSTANTCTIFVGKNAEGTPVIYIDGIGDVKIEEVKSLNELVSYIADNSEAALGSLGVSNTTVAKLLSQLLSGDEVLGDVGNAIEVRSGVPTKVGKYCVYAIAGAYGYAPAIACGKFTILAHIWGPDIVITPATCTEKGKSQHTCQRDICRKTKDFDVPALGHKPVYVDGKDATCTEDGYTDSSYCDVCGETLKASETIPASHKWGDWVKTDATCTEDGNETRTCMACKSVETVTIKKTGHTEVLFEGTAPTCTETGLTAGKQCSVCEAWIEPQKQVPALGHDTEKRDPVAATCTETGLSEGTHCKRCGEDPTPQVVLPALGHESVVDAAVPAQCTETGLTEGAHCDRCNEVLIAQETTPAIGHAYGAWSVVREATAAVPGLRERVCAHNASHVEQESIAYVAPGGGDTPGGGGDTPGGGTGGGTGTDAGTTAATGADAGTGADAAAVATATIADNPTPRASQNVANNETPLASLPVGSWSLVSLLCMILSVVLVPVLALRSAGNRKMPLIAIAAVIAVVSLAVFFMASNLAAPMVAINGMTFLHALLLVGNAAVAFFAMRQAPQTAN